MQRTPRSRRNRMDGITVPLSLRLAKDLAQAVEEVARSEYRNNRSAVIEQAVIEFLNRRRDPRAA
jgi:metal-responsive CopG/Arc/MetJ family transcriptional regulator